jgi:hypothetical protein
MATIRPFAYNIGSVLSGTTQYGTLAVGVDRNLPYSGNYGGLRWWMGPDEDLGYCVGTSVTDNDQPTEPGIIPPFGNVEFWRTESFSDSEFISLSNNISGQNFTSSAEAVTWLNDNGYWTSYSGISPSPTPTTSSTPTLTPTPTSSEIPVTPSATVTPTPTSSEVSITPTPTPSSTPTSGPTPSSGFTVTIQEVGSDVVWSGSGSLDLSNLSFETTQDIGAGFNATGAIWALGPTAQTSCDAYGGAAFSIFPTTFGTGGAPANAGSGDILSILDNGIGGRTLLVPLNYVSGSPLSGTTTYENTTISGLNLISGTYTYSWGNENGETLTLIIG